MNLYLNVLVLVLVSQNVCMDLRGYDITWDLPVPTKSGFTPVVADATTNAAAAVSTTVPASTLLTTPLATTTNSAITDDFAFSEGALSTEKIVGNLDVDFAYALEMSVPAVSAKGATSTEGLASTVGLTTTGGLSTTKGSLTNDGFDGLAPSISTLEEMEYEMLNLENEVRNLNTTQANKKDSMENIWTKVVDFLSSSDGPAFLITVITLGIQRYSLLCSYYVLIPPS